MGNEATAGVKAPFLPPLYSSCLKNSLPPLHRELTPTATGRRRPHPLLTALPASPRRGPRWLPLMTALGRVAQGVSLARGSAFPSLSCLQRACKTDTNEASSFV